MKKNLMYPIYNTCEARFHRDGIALPHIFDDGRFECDYCGKDEFYCRVVPAPPAGVDEDTGARLADILSAAMKPQQPKETTPMNDRLANDLLVATGNMLNSCGRSTVVTREKYDCKLIVATFYVVGDSTENINGVKVIRSVDNKLSLRQCVDLIRDRARIITGIFEDLNAVVDYATRINTAFRVAGLDLTFKISDTYEQNYKL